MSYSLVVVCVASFLFTGCAAGKVYLDQDSDRHASCKKIEQELQLAQHKINALEETDHTLQNLSSVFLTAAQIVFAPIGVLNAILTVSDSHLADAMETEALKDQHNEMVAISNQKNCDYKYAMIQRSAGAPQLDLALSKQKEVIVPQKPKVESSSSPLTSFNKKIVAVVAPTAVVNHLQSRRKLSGASWAVSKRVTIPSHHVQDFSPPEKVVDKHKGSEDLQS